MKFQFSPAQRVRHHRCKVSIVSPSNKTQPPATHWYISVAHPNLFTRRNVSFTIPRNDDVKTATPPPPISITTQQMRPSRSCAARISTTADLHQSITIAAHRLQRHCRQRVRPDRTARPNRTRRSNCRASPPTIRRSNTRR